MNLISAAAIAKQDGRPSVGETTHPQSRVGEATVQLRNPEQRPESLASRDTKARTEPTGKVVGKHGSLRPPPSKGENLAEFCGGGTFSIFVLSLATACKY